MKYREAKQLQIGDKVIRISDNEILIINNIIVYGQFKKVTLECSSSNEELISVNNDEVK